MRYLVLPPVPPSAAPQSYSTNFPLTEARIAESGKWQHTDGTAGNYAGNSNWGAIATNGSVAYGTQTGTDANTGIGQTNNRYSDSYAVYVPNVGANYRVTGVFRKGTIGAGNHEVAIFLRALDGVDTMRGYECGIHSEGTYGGVTRWNGQVADFTSPGAWQFGPISACADGDIFVAEITGNTITMKRNGTTLVTVDITTAGGGSTWTSGQPGFACFRSAASSDQADFGWKSMLIEPL